MYMYTVSQPKQLTARIFRVYDPYNPDNSLNKLESKYRAVNLRAVSTWKLDGAGAKQVLCKKFPSNCPASTLRSSMQCCRGSPRSHAQEAGLRFVIRDSALYVLPTSCEAHTQEMTLLEYGHAFCHRSRNVMQCCNKTRLVVEESHNYFLPSG